MGMYTGVPCAKCGKPFVEGDDIVVCPICGAPHHRACYQEEGQCARAASHGTNDDWKSPNQPAAEASVQVRICRVCGGENPVDGMFCQHCGNKLEGEVQSAQAPSQPSSDAYGREQYARYAKNPEALPTPVGPVTPDEDFGGVTAREIAAFVGPNSRYFLTNFKVMKESGRSYTFNWPSFFVNYCYYFYRKMYRPALILLAAIFVLSIPKLLYSQEYVKYYISTYFNHPIPYNAQLLDQLIGIARITNILQFVLMFATAIFSNRIYMGFVVRRIKKVRASVPTDADPKVYFQALERSGRPNAPLGFASALFSAAIIFFVSYLMAINIVL